MNNPFKEKLSRKKLFLITTISSIALILISISIWLIFVKNKEDLAIQPTETQTSKQTYTLQDIKDNKDCVIEQIGKQAYTDYLDSKYNFQPKEEEKIIACINGDIEYLQNTENIPEEPNDQTNAQDNNNQEQYELCLKFALDEDWEKALNNEEQYQEVVSKCQEFRKTESNACLIDESYDYSYLGKAITYDMISNIDGYVADSSAVRLSDGRIRIYFGAGSKILSATSTSIFKAPYTNISFKLDTGDRTNGGYMHPRVIKTDNGKYRMFTTKGDTMDKLYSFISTDGLTFTKEEGIRIDLSNYNGLETMSGAGIAKVNNTWKLYFSTMQPENPIPERDPLVIYGATSQDMINWESVTSPILGINSGVEGFETDDQGRGMDAEHPMAFITEENKIGVIFRTTNMTCITYSEDGSNFDHPILISHEQLSDNYSGNDPDILKLEDGIFFVTGTNGGPTPEGHIRMGILRISH